MRTISEFLIFGIVIAKLQIQTYKSEVPNSELINYKSQFWTFDKCQIWDLGLISPKSQNLGFISNQIWDLGLIIRNLGLGTYNTKFGTWDLGLGTYKSQVLKFGTWDL